MLTHIIYYGKKTKNQIKNPHPASQLYEVNHKQKRNTYKLIVPQLGIEPRFTDLTMI